MAADLTKISLFEGLRVEDLLALGARTEVRELPADALVIKQGDPPDSLLAILRGKVKVYLLDANGKEFVVDVRGAGGYVRSEERRVGKGGKRGGGTDGDW